MKKYIIKKRTRSLLCVLIISGLIGQMLASARPEAKVTKMGEQLPAQSALTVEAPEIVEEAEEFRSEYSKSYLRSDGTYVQVTAMKPIHYKNGDRYEEIDSRLQKVTKGEKTYYKNRKGSYQVSFPEELQEPVEIEYRNYTLSMQMVYDETNQEESVADGLDENVAKTVNETAVEAGKSHVFKKSDLQNRKSKIVAVSEESLNTLEEDKSNEDILPEYKTGEIKYTNDEEDVSITYQSSSDKIKESIIINNADAVQESYVYQVDAGKLKADKTKDGRILFYKKTKKNPVFVLEAPYMFDASGEESISYDIETELVENEDGYQIIYSPSSEWLFSEDRKFPVTIDPTVSLIRSDNQFTDGYVFSRFATTNYNGTASAVLYPSNMSTYYFKSSSLPNGDTAIISSKLHLHADSIEGEPKIQVKRVTSAWDPATLTYASRPTTESVILDYATVTSSTVLDITPYAQDFSKKVENYGLEIGVFTGSGSCTIPTVNASSNSPYIVTEYSILAGDYNEMSCHTASAGRAGTITINDFTGYMQYEAEDLAIPGNRMPVSIKRVNTAGGADASAGFGSAFFTNYHQKLVWNGREGKWKFRTEKGGFLYFKYEDGKITDEQDAGYELEINGMDPSDYTIITITNPEGHKLFFNSDGNLIRIEDEAQAEISKIDITYLATDKIDQITDGAGGRYKFIYNGNLITEIQYLGKTGTTVIKKVSYEYYSSMSVYVEVRVYYDDNNYSTCAVEASNVKKLSNDDGSGIDISYYNFNSSNTGNPYYNSKVKKITEYGRNRTKGDELTFTYDTMQTTIADSNGNKEIYQFDRYGKITSVRNQEGEAVFPQYGGEQGQLLGFSDIRSTTIGYNQYNNSHNLDAQLVSSIKYHDSSIPVLDGKAYQELYTTYDKNYVSEFYAENPTSFKTGDTILFGAWLKGSFQSAGDGSESNRGVTFELKVNKSDGETETYEVKPNLYVSDWQYVLGEVELDYNAADITLYLKINGQMNHVNISNVEFKRIEDEEIDASPEPEPETTPAPTPVTDSYGNILSETDERGAVTTYTYDAAGNELTRTITADGKYLYSNNYYDIDKNMLTTEIGTSGIGYAYSYNNDKTLRAVTDSGLTFETTGTGYQYNSLGEVTKITQASNRTDYFDNELSENVNYTYADDRQTITTDNNTYTVMYNPFGDVSEIKHGDDSLVSYEYESNSNRIPKKVTYGNGDIVEYEYDDKNRLTYDGHGTYTYNEKGELESVKDSANDTVTRYEGDTTLVYEDNATSNLLYEYETTEDGFRFEKDEAEIKEQYQDTDYANGISQKTLSYYGSNIATHKETTDKLGRLSQTDVIKPNNNNVLKKNFQYKDLSGNRTTEQVSRIDYTFGNGAVSNETYTYNNYGQIESITDAEGNVRHYKYDGFGQLIREDDPVKDRSIVYSYSEGNITKKEEYAYTTADTLGTCIGETNYTYGNNDWKDLLTSYNGQTITYDEIGNPISYMGNTLAWDKGRQLQSNTASNGETIEYKYDVNGLRTQKKVGNTTHEYTYVNGQLYAYEVNGQRMFFTYDDNGSPLSCIYNGVAYHYQTNLQGDVIGIVNNSGTKVVTYSYDAWGYPTGSIPTSGVGYMNPLRYRGYVYDFETEFYYVSSRYYDPGVGRFLNLDEFVTTGQGVLSYNMYAYCLNNPVNRVDYTGNSSTALKWWSSTMWWLCGADSILPFGDTLYVGGMLVLGAVALGTASNTAVMIPKVTPKIKIKTKEIEKVKVVTKSKSQTRLIYRYGKTNPGNLTPKKKDKYTGLSFSTVPPPAGTPAVVTTIGRLNSTGKVIAIQDGLTHVSVIPAPHMGTLQNWIDTGSSHPCTEAVKSVVIKWNGVY